MTTLRVRPRPPDAKGLVTDITPSNAGWRYVGFQVRHLRERQRVDLAYPGREACIVVLAGVVDIEAGGWSSSSTSAAGARCSRTQRLAPSTRRPAFRSA